MIQISEASQVFESFMMDLNSSSAQPFIQEAMTYVKEAIYPAESLDRSNYRLYTHQEQAEIFNVKKVPYFLVCERQRNELKALNEELIRQTRLADNTRQTKATARMAPANNQVKMTGAMVWRQQRLAD